MGQRGPAPPARGCQSGAPSRVGEQPDDSVGQLTRVPRPHEQPGVRDDLVGRPFVGPSGQLLDDALVDAGLVRDALYVTNAVKHFRFEQRGKMRLHKNPDRMHIDACSMWLARELSLVRPRIVVCLGANAASIVLGRDFRLMRERGTWRTLANDTRAIATVHPSWILRQRGGIERDAAYGGFVDDLRLVAEAAAA